MIDLVSKRFLFVLASLLIIIPGLIAIFAGGLKPGIDFTGGTRLTVIPSNPQATSDQFREALARAGYEDAVVKSGTIGEGDIITRTMTMDIPRISDLKDRARDAERSKVAHELRELVPVEDFTASVELTPTNTLTPTAVVTGTSVITPAVTAGTTVTTSTTITGTPAITATGTTTSTTGTTTPPTTETVTYTRIKESALVDDITVGPTVGRELIGRAFLAVLVTSIALLIYLTLVFRKVPNAFRYGVCAVLAVLHDVLVVVGVFAILGLIFGTEIDALFITAMLTVIGFSVHDTIVVFDRVRENIARRRFDRFEEVVNYSLVQTLARSINTSITVILTLFALYLFGGSSIHNFVLALLIGIISGTYSSIFNASMLLVIWENREWTGRRKNDTPATNVRGAATR
ncbi:MAG TPA: protein translocase subunit SecF [Chloroflexia bacterium]|nr:protein translocase subunit SecF [Chloroflexia bacterium]